MDEGTLKSNGSNGNGTTTADLDLADVTYRILSDEQVPLMAPLYEARGWPVPDPAMGKVLVAETGDKIVGFATIAFVLHAQDFWIDMRMRGTGMAEELMRQVVDYIEKDSNVKRYVCTAKPGSFGARLAEKNGMTLVPDLALYTKTVPPEKIGQ